VVRRSAVALVFALLAVAAMGSAGGADGIVQVRAVDTSHFPTVKLTVSVEGDVISPDALVVTENGRSVHPTAVRSLGASGTNVDVVLAIDTSNSMRGEPVATAFGAARTFLARVPTWVHVGVLTFSWTPEVLAPLGTSRDALATLLASPPETTQGTALYDALDAAASMFSGDGQRNVILLTDGRRTAGSTDLEAAVATARKAHVTVFPVGLRGENTDATTLQLIADGTGGTYAGATNASLDAAYSSLADRLTRQYIVTYRSKAPVGTTSRVDVTVGDVSDTISFLAPFPSGTGSSGRSALEEFLQGPYGMAMVLVVCFLTFFLALDTVLGRRAERRRKRDLASRMLAPAPHTRQRQPSDRTGPLAWIPDPVAFAAENAVPGQLSGRVARSLERAGWAVRPGEFIAVCACAAIVGAAFGAAVVPIHVAGLLLGVVTGAIPPLLLSRAIGRRQRAFQEQLPDLLTILATSLRAGHSFMQALNAVTSEADEPAASEFTRIETEIRLGRGTDDSLLAAAERMGSDDFRWTAMAINIQRQVGGNLAEVLETVAGTCREREMIRRQVRVLSAEGRLSVGILFAMPFLLAAYLFVVNPKYLATLVQEPIGILLLLGTGILLLVGFVWMRKIVRIDV
jgi:tight adherence protein B